MTSIEKATIYADEALLLRWGDSSANGRTVTLQLQEHGDHPFRGLPSGKSGQRVAIVVTLIGDDEQPAAPEDARRETPADKAIKKAHALAGDIKFHNWLFPTMTLVADLKDEYVGMALDKLRYRCGVSSTTEFRTNPEALKRFNDLCWEYEHRSVVR